MKQVFKLDGQKLIQQNDIIAKPDLLITNQNHNQKLDECSEPLNRLIKIEGIKQCLQDEDYREILRFNNVDMNLTMNDINDTNFLKKLS